MAQSDLTTSDEGFEEPETEEVINALVDATPVFAQVPELTSLALWNFMVDVAQNIHDYETIATRYGFENGWVMTDFLKTHPEIRRRIKELRANFQSNENLQVRLRTLAGHALENAIPVTARIMLDEGAKPQQLEALKHHARIAGVDGLPAVGRDGVPMGGAANKFSVQIVFASTGTVENFSTVPTIEGEEQ